MQQQNKTYFQMDSLPTLNPDFNNHGIYIANQIDPTQIYESLYFQFQIKPIQSIRLQKDNNKQVCKITFNNFQVFIRVVKNSDQFIFEQGRYQNYLVAQIQFNGNTVQIGKKKINFMQWENFLISFNKTIQYQVKSPQNLWGLVPIKTNIQKCSPIIQFGSLQNSKVFECVIKNIKLANFKSELKTTLNQQSSQIILEQGPMDMIPKTQIPDIESLPIYKSPPEKPMKLYLCHDMQGGYRQDMNQYFPYPQQSNNYKPQPNFAHTYRSFHLGQTSIFNYFSHYLISIPPKHWRRVCRQNKTKCLGTIIIQGKQISQNQYLTDYTVKLLVYLSRKYGFDGYLINFQYKINQVNKLLIPWLSYLVKQIHKAVPGSQIIWYDSVITNGFVSYQNQINSFNSVFYDLCDGMFLNYWWNKTKIQNSLKFKKQGKSINVGSDCFGRNTFGGGGFNTYVAIAAMKQVDKSLDLLNPALFAMGYTYQNSQNVQEYKIYEKSMYRGITHSKIKIPLQKWQYQNKDKLGFKWKIQKQAATTSFQECKRTFSIKLNQSTQKQNLVAQFFTNVSIEPAYYNNNFYKATLILKVQQIQVNEVSTGKITLDSKQKLVQLKMNIDADLIGKNTVLVIIQEGNGCDPNQGKKQHVGVKFKDQILYLLKYKKQNDWISLYNANLENMISLPYLSHYNVGNGKYFYLEGTPIKKGYDFLSDFELCYAYSMNPPTSVNIQYNDAYIGGTCLMVEQTAKLKIAETLIQKNKKIFCRIVTKTLSGVPKYNLTYKINQITQSTTQSTQKKLQNNWIQTVFIIDPKQCSQQSQKMELSLQHQFYNKYLLGQTSIYYEDHQQSKNNIQKLVIELSDFNPIESLTFFNIQLKLSRSQKVLIRLDGGYACFGHADQLSNNTVLIKNIHGKQGKKSNKLSICSLDNHLQYVPIYEYDINYNQLKQRKLMKLI